MFLLQNYKSRLFIDYGSGRNKKGCWLKDFALNEANSSALLGLRFLIFSKRKLKCWKTLQNFSKFEDCFSQLGAEWDEKKRILKFDGCSFKRNMQKKISKKSLTCQHYHLAVMISKYILKEQMLLQKFRDLL